MKVTVAVYHNEARDPEGRMLAWTRGYRHADPVRLVTEFELGFDRRDVGEVLEYVWRAMNRVDGSVIERVPEGERSLCVGDVVELAIPQLQTRRFAAAFFGWTEFDTGLNKTGGRA